MTNHPIEPHPGSRRPLPEVAEILSHFEVDLQAGTLRWRPRSELQMPHPALRGSWNAQFAGRLAGSRSGRYSVVTLKGVSYLLHRLIFKVATGRDPDVLDHVNGDSRDNSITNLREVSQQVNSMNSAMPSTNKSGCVGVRWDKREDRWRSYIKVSQRQITLGYFRSYGDAVAARKKAERRYGFHPNHGRIPGEGAAA